MLLLDALITLNKGESFSKNSKEWAIIELQGDLDTRTNEDMHSKFVGDLHYNKHGQPILTIGHHVLQGKEQKLDKPFAVLERIKCHEINPVLTQENPNATNCNINQSNYNAEHILLDDTVALENKSKQKTEYVVSAVCTKKLIFNARPKPIVVNVAKST